MNKDTDSKTKKNSVYSKTSAQLDFGAGKPCSDEDDFSWDYEFDDLDDDNYDYTKFPVNNYVNKKTAGNYVNRKQSDNDAESEKKISEKERGEKNTMSSMSLAAFIFSIFGPFSIVGIILAFVDLAHRRKEDNVKYNHSASVLAIVFGVLWITFGVIVFLINYTQKDKEPDTGSYYEEDLTTDDDLDDEYVNEAFNDFNSEEEAPVNEFVPSNPMTKGMYIAGSDFEVGKYTFKVYEGVGEIHIYNSKEEYEADSLEVGGVYSYHVKAENASKEEDTPDYYTEYISNVDFAEGMCLLISGDVSVDRRASLSDYGEGNITAGTYLVGEDIDAGTFDFIAAKGFGDVCIYSSRDAFLSDEHGLQSDATYHIMEPSSDLGQNSPEKYETYLSSLELSEGMMMVIKDSLVLEYGNGSGFDDLLENDSDMTEEFGLGIDSESANMDRNGGRTSSIDDSGSSKSSDSASNDYDDSAYTEAQLEEAYQQIFDYYDENLKNYADDFINSSNDTPQDSADDSYSIYQDAVSAMSGLVSNGVDEFGSIYSENGSSNRQYQNWCDRLNSSYNSYINDVKNSLTYSVD